MIPIALLIAPWSVGPAPSAHDVSPGLQAGASASGFLGGPRALAGGSAELAYGAGERLWVSLEAQAGSGWTTCPDCQTFAGTATARGVLIHHPRFQFAPWMVSTGTGGTLEWTPGVAIEGGGERVRVDTSWPLWSTWDLLTTLRITPELGVSYRWSESQNTRAAIVGLEPAVALQHRARVAGSWTLEGTARFGEEGLGAQVAVSWGGRPDRAL